MTPGAVALALALTLRATGGTPEMTREEAYAYLDVAEAESRARAWPTAILAYERVARVLGRDPRVAGGLGVAYARLGRVADAEAQLRRARALGDTRPVTLLELGMVLVRRGAYAEARALLAEIKDRDEPPELWAAARFFQALSAMRLGDDAAAREGFGKLAGGAEPFATQAKRMVELVRTPPRLALSFSLRGDYDTNALLLPGTPSTIALPAPEDDFAAQIGFGLQLRPFASVDLVLRDNLFYREWRDIDELDLFGNLAALDYRLRRGPHLLTAGYQFEYYLLAREPYLVVHHVGAGYEYRFSEWLRVGAGLALLVRRFQNPAFMPFSGEGFQGRVSAMFLGPPSEWSLEVGYLPTVEITDERDLGFQGHGFFGAVSFHPRTWFMASAGAQVSLRFFLAPDEVLHQTRHDVETQLFGALTFRPARPVRLVLSASYVKNSVNLTLYDYDRFLVSLATILDVEAF